MVIDLEMGKIWDYNKRYFVIRRYVDFLTKASFSSITIEGQENIPKDAAVLFAPNHCCALMDPLMLLVTSREAKGFGARSDIFRNPKIAKFLRFLKIVPIARERNGLQAVAGNFKSFDEIIECFERNFHFCLFAEGTHNADGGMLPMKKGSFKLCRQASEKLQKPIYIVPTALDYQYYFREGGAAAIRFAPAIEISQYFAERSDKFEADIYKELCESIRNTILSMLKQLPERNHNNKFLRSIILTLLLPVFCVFALASFPIWLPATILAKKSEDKAWTHTIFFGFVFALPVFFPFYWVYTRLSNKYYELIEDFKK